MCVCMEMMMLRVSIIITVFARSEAAATVLFCWQRRLLFERGVIRPTNTQASSLNL